jgi:hypothetical protein
MAEDDQVGMREKALSELRKDCIAAFAMLAICTMVGGIVSMLHGWLAVAAVLSLADPGRA